MGSSGSWMFRKWGEGRGRRPAACSLAFHSSGGIDMARLGGIEREGEPGTTVGIEDSGLLETAVW